MLKEKLLDDLKNSMKEKNVIRKNVIQMVRAAILQVEKDKQIEVSDDQIVEIIAKEAKKRKDSIADYEKSGRQDLLDQINQEIAILEEYLPEQLSAEEIEAKVKEIIAELGATSMKEMGLVMKTAKEKLGASADSLSFKASSPFNSIGISLSTPFAPTIAGIERTTSSMPYCPCIMCETGRIDFSSRMITSQIRLTDIAIP